MTKKLIDTTTCTRDPNFAVIITSLCSAPTYAAFLHIRFYSIDYRLLLSIKIIIPTYINISFITNSVDRRK